MRSRPTVRGPGRWLASLLVVVCAGCGGAAPATAPSPGPAQGSSSATSSAPAAPEAEPASAPGTAQILATRHVGGRTWDLTVRSPAVGADVSVRLLLPVRYEQEPGRRWPVLYLLHGCCDSFASWTRSTDVEQLSRSTDVLVVMPDGGDVGFYSDWRRGPRWETFHVIELPALLSRTYRASSRQAVAGVSMGGLGALGYAARHPGTFAVAASFSGVVDTQLSDGESQAYLDLAGSYGADGRDLWGDPVTDEETWDAHDPIRLAPELRTTRLFVSAGDGRPGPLDPRGTTTDQTEAAIGAENEAFVARLRALHLDAQIDLYGPGTHSWTYWQRELHRAWPLLRHGLRV